MMSKSILALAFVAIVTPAFAADYQTNLGPMPLDDETKMVIGGRGEATVSSDGKTMTVKGSFQGLLSNATEAHVFLSPVAGAPGEVGALLKALAAAEEAARQRDPQR